MFKSPRAKLTHSGATSGSSFVALQTDSQRRVERTDHLKLPRDRFYSPRRYLLALDRSARRVRSIPSQSQMSMRILKGHRIGKGTSLMVGCAAVIFESPARNRILLTRRADNGKWCLPGGRMEPGESAIECCEREVFEET